MHKFKIGEIVNYRPSTRTTRNVAGTFKVIAFLPEGFGEPVYRTEPMQLTMYLPKQSTPDDEAAN
jgi:hypothetical protein